LLDEADQLVQAATESSKGVVSIVLAGLTPGDHTYHIDYPGDTNHTAATSSPFTLHILPALTKSALSTPTLTLIAGQPLSLNVSLSSTATILGDRTGTVTFMDGQTPVGTATVSGNTATLPISSLALGAHKFSAVYSGDSNFKASHSNVLKIPVAKAHADVSLTTSATGPVASGESFDLTAQVSIVSPGTGMPTGAVTFKDGATTLGTVSLDPTGTAVLTTSLLTSGTRKITAVYGGDLLTLPATSPILSQIVS
jgi:hypothetical protein